MSRARRRAFALIPTAAVMATAHGARADQSLHAITIISTGYTDNVQLVPDNPTDPTLVPRVQSDSFANVAPGLVFANEGPRTAHVVRYTLNARLYAEQTNANSYSNSLAYQGVIRASPRTDIGLDAAASHGRLNAFDTSPDQTSLDTRAQGDVSYARAGVGASLSRTLSHSLRFREAVSASIFQPTDDTTQVRSRYTLENAVSLTKTLKVDAFSGALRTLYSSLDRGEEPDEESVTAAAEGRWVRDLNESWSTDAMAGVAFTVRADDFKRGVALPVGALYLRYQKDRYAGAVGYRHQIATNILVGETEATNTVDARGTMAFPWYEAVSISGAVGFAQGRSLDFEARELIGKTNRWIGDLSIGWRVSPGMRLGARYQIVYQSRTQPNLGIMNERTRRNQFMVVLEGRYPSRQAVEIERRNDGRADGGEDTIDAKREGGRVR